MSDDSVIAGDIDDLSVKEKLEALLKERGLYPHQVLHHTMHDVEGEVEVCPPEGITAFESRAVTTGNTYLDMTYLWVRHRGVFVQQATRIGAFNQNHIVPVQWGCYSRTHPLRIGFGLRGAPSVFPEVTLTIWGIPLVQDPAMQVPPSKSNRFGDGDLLSHMTMDRRALVRALQQLKRAGLDDTDDPVLKSYFEGLKDIL